MHILLTLATPDRAEVDAALAARPAAVVVDCAGLTVAAAGDLAAAARAAGVAVLPRLAGADASDAALASALAFDPATVLLAGAVGRADVEHLAARLAVAEARLGLDDGRVAIAAAADSAAGILALGDFGRDAGRAATPRLAALAWDGRDRARDGAARTLVLAAAAAAGVAAIDGASPPAVDLAAEVAAAARDGFAAKLVERPQDVALARAAARGARPGATSAR